MLCWIVRQAKSARGQHIPRVLMLWSEPTGHPSHTTFKPKDGRKARKAVSHFPESIPGLPLGPLHRACGLKVHFPSLPPGGCACIYEMNTPTLGQRQHSVFLLLILFSAKSHGCKARMKESTTSRLSRTTAQKPGLRRPLYCCCFETSGYGFW